MRGIARDRYSIELISIKRKSTDGAKLESELAGNGWNQPELVALCQADRGRLTSDVLLFSIRSSDLWRLTIVVAMSSVGSPPRYRITSDRGIRPLLTVLISPR